MEVLREDDMKRAQWLARARADLSTREAVRQGETAATEKTTRLRQMIHSAAVEQRQLRADIKERIRESRALLPLDFVLRRALRHYRVAKLNWGLERWGRFIHGCHVLDQERILFAPRRRRSSASCEACLHGARWRARGRPTRSASYVGGTRRG